MLTPDEVVHGYIGARAAERTFETPYFDDPDDFNGAETLSFNAVGADDMSPSQRRARLVRWQQAFPLLSARHLVLAGRSLDQDTFDCALQVRGLETLVVYQSRIENIDAIARASGLLAVRIKSSRPVQGYEPLGRLPRLKSIVLDNPKNLGSLCFLEHVPQLEELSILHDADRSLVLDSLLPLRSLTRLQRLVLGGAFKVRDGGLSPLHGLPMLENAHIGIYFAEEEFRTLRERTPSLWCGTPFDQGLIAEFAGGRHPA